MAPTQASFGWQSHLACLGFQGGCFGGRRGSGSDSQTGSDSSWLPWPRGVCRGEGLATARSGPRPCRAWRETGARSELPVSAQTLPNQALFPRKLVPCLPSASLRPISSPYFFQRDGHGRGGLHTDCHGSPERRCPWLPRRSWGRLKLVGCTRPGWRRRGAWR